MNRSTRPSRPGLTGSSRQSLLLARAGGIVLEASPSSTTAIDLRWTDGDVKEDGFKIERSTDGVSFSQIATVGSGVLSYNDTGLTESVEYYYRVREYLGADDYPYSNIASTWTVPDTPTGLTATAISSTQIDLAWSDVSTGNTAQSIQRRSPAGSGSYSFIASVGATATSYSDTGLTASTQYEYQVAATNPATQSAWSTAADATTAGGGPPASSWSLDFSTGEPWSNGTNYVFSSTASTSRTFVNSSGYVAPCVANLLQRSEDLANGYWTKTDSSIGSTSITAPDGTSTADELVENTANSSHNCLSGFTPVSGTTYTLTVYAKANTRSIVYLTGLGLIGAGKLPQFDLSAGTDVSVGTGMTTSITSVGSGWYRCRVTYTATGTGSAGFGILNAVQTTTNISYLGDGSSSAYFWGAQIVTGTAALPYSATTTSSNGIPRLTHNSSGSRLGLLVEEQRANLILQSEDFTTTWVNSDTTESGNTVTAPDNTTTADTITEGVSGAGFGHDIRQTVTRTFTIGESYTFTVYAKAGTATVLQLAFQVAIFGNNEWANFDLTNGVLGSVGTDVTGSDATITSVGNGWYRCKLTGVVQTGGASAICVCGFTNNQATSVRLPQYAVTSGNEKSLYLWGAQLEAASTATSYIPTTNASVTREADIAYVETADVTNWGRPGSFVVEYYKPLEQSGGVVVADDDGAGNAGRLGVEYSAGGPRIVYGTSGSGSGGTDTAGLNKIGWAWNGSGAATRSALNGSALDTSLATSFDPTLTDGINLGGNIDWTSLPLTVSGQPNVVIRKVQFYNSQLSAADLNTLTT